MSKRGRGSHGSGHSGGESEEEDEDAMVGGNETTLVTGDETSHHSHSHKRARTARDIGHLFTGDLPPPYLALKSTLDDLDMAQEDEREAIETAIALEYDQLKDRLRTMVERHPLAAFAHSICGFQTHFSIPPRPEMLFDLSVANEKIDFIIRNQRLLIKLNDSIKKRQVHITQKKKQAEAQGRASLRKTYEELTTLERIQRTQLENTTRVLEQLTKMEDHLGYATLKKREVALDEYIKRSTSILTKGGTIDTLVETIRKCVDDVANAKSASSTASGAVKEMALLAGLTDDKLTARSAEWSINARTDGTQILYTAVFVVTYLALPYLVNWNSLTDHTNDMLPISPPGNHYNVHHIVRLAFDAINIQSNQSGLSPLVLKSIKDITTDDLSQTRAKYYRALLEPLAPVHISHKVNQSANATLAEFDLDDSMFARGQKASNFTGRDVLSIPTDPTTSFNAIGITMALVRHLTETTLGHTVSPPSSNPSDVIRFWIAYATVVLDRLQTTLALPTHRPDVLVQHRREWGHLHYVVNVLETLRTIEIKFIVPARKLLDDSTATGRITTLHEGVKNALNHPQIPPALENWADASEDENIEDEKLGKILKADPVEAWPSETLTPTSLVDTHAQRLVVKLLDEIRGVGVNDIPTTPIINPDNVAEVVHGAMSKLMDTVEFHSEKGREDLLHTTERLDKLKNEANLKKLPLTQADEEQLLAKSLLEKFQNRGGEGDEEEEEEEEEDSMSEDPHFIADPIYHTLATRVREITRLVSAAYHELSRMNIIKLHDNFQAYAVEVFGGLASLRPAWTRTVGDWVRLATSHNETARVLFASIIASNKGLMEMVSSRRTGYVPVHPAAQITIVKATDTIKRLLDINPYDI